MAVTKVKASTESYLQMELHAPGMGPFHRAGLGGLACALRYIEDRANDLPPEQIPGHPWKDNPPWIIEPHRIRLEFGALDGAREFLGRLFQATFQLSKGLIYLPCLFSTRPTTLELAEFQRGLVLTFLQHGKTRSLAKTETHEQIEVEPGSPPLGVDYRVCSGYKHQSLWEDLVDKKGRLTRSEVEVSGPTLPGAAVRHVAFSSDTRVSDPPQRFLPLCFSLVGALAIPVHKGKAVLLVPEVVDLVRFAVLRPELSPTQYHELRAAGEADAVLQALTRLQASRALRTGRLPGFYTMTFESTPWASQQKSRVSTLHIKPDLTDALRRFEHVWASLPPRFVTKKDGSEILLKHGLSRPHLAENLALEQPFYRGFTQLMINHHDEMRFERKGLSKLMQSPILDHPAEKALVLAVQRALSRRYAQIADETRDNPSGRDKRWKNEYERWRIAFAGSKTADQFRHQLCDLLSRAGSTKILRESWQDILPELLGPRWCLARDLSLLAICSYAGRGGEAEESDTEEGEAE